MIVFVTVSSTESRHVDRMKNETSGDICLGLNFTPKSPKGYLFLLQNATDFDLQPAERSEASLSKKCNPIKILHPATRGSG